eukprot:scaffold574_cov190-Amphora_coffeaeformis.AAC.2
MCLISFTIVPWTVTGMNIEYSAQRNTPIAPGIKFAACSEEQEEKCYGRDTAKGDNPLHDYASLPYFVGVLLQFCIRFPLPSFGCHGNAVAVHTVSHGPVRDLWLVLFGYVKENN